MRVSTFNQRVKAGFERVERLRERLAARFEAKPRSRADAPSPDAAFEKAPRLRYRFDGLFPGARARRLHAEELAAVPPDPLKILFSAPSDGTQTASRPLLEDLTASAQKTRERSAELRMAAWRVRDALKRRALGEAFFDGQLLRLGVAAIWAFGFLYFMWPYLSGLLDPADAQAGPVSADHRLIGRSFLYLTLIGAAAAVAPAFVGWAAGSFSDDAINSKAQEFGWRIARMLKEIDARLKAHRDALGDAQRRDSAVASEVSKAHLAAQEAMLLLNEVGFLFDEETRARPDSNDPAAQEFRRYLDRSAVVTESKLDLAYWQGVLPGMIVGLLLGALLGALAILSVFKVEPVVLLQRIGFDGLGAFAKEPVAVLAILGGGVLFAAAGDIGRAVNSLARGKRNRELKAALMAVRSAITGDQAPRARDIAQRVEDLSEIFRTRIAKGGSQVADHADIPQWRRAPEAPRFVDPGFQAAPKAFVAEGKGPGGGKIRVRGPAPKRGGQAVE